ncbi:uncharacterized protein LOC116271490 [Papio anubis]|uniref:uncharacterized protein LOC116271490 n=1 Tax=Papio anubis TaxID=9555 RepID=UPI0012ADFA41|nr:uncharacterized protein LOC116271490 [Papio anubis]
MWSGQDLELSRPSVVCPRVETQGEGEAQPRLSLGQRGAASPTGSPAGLSGCSYDTEGIRGGEETPYLARQRAHRFWSKIFRDHCNRVGRGESSTSSMEAENLTASPEVQSRDGPQADISWTLLHYQPILRAHWIALKNTRDDSELKPLKDGLVDFQPGTYFAVHIILAHSCVQSTIYVRGHVSQALYYGLGVQSRKHSPCPPGTLGPQGNQAQGGTKGIVVVLREPQGSSEKCGGFSHRGSPRDLACLPPPGPVLLTRLLWFRFDFSVGLCLSFQLLHKASPPPALSCLSLPCICTAIVTCGIKLGA